MTPEEKAAAYREMARCTYEPQMTAWKDKAKGVSLPGAWSIGGKVHEPWAITFFGPMAGEFSYTVDGSADSMSCTNEYRMYWTGFPDFQVTEYKVWTIEDGWIARITFKGTAPDGTVAEVHQADIATVDEQGRLSRMEWFVDTEQWRQRVWSKSSGLSMDELRALLAQPGGFQKLIDHTLSLPNAA
jgi:hypothetical protein